MVIEEGQCLMAGERRCRRAAESQTPPHLEVFVHLEHAEELGRPHPLAQPRHVSALLHQRPQHLSACRGRRRSADIFITAWPPPPPCSAPP